MMLTKNALEKTMLDTKQSLKIFCLTNERNLLCIWVESSAVKVLANEVLFESFPYATVVIATQRIVDFAGIKLG